MKARGETIEVPEWFQNKLTSLADTFTRLRTPVHVDKYENMTYEAVPEFGGRVGKALLMLAKGHALLDGRKQLEQEDYDILVRLSVDGLPWQRKRILKACLAEDEALTTSQLNSMTAIPTSSTVTILN